MVKWLLAVLASWGEAASILLVSAPIERFLWHRVTIAAERLTGMIPTAITVQMFLNGLDRRLHR